MIVNYLTHRKKLSNTQNSPIMRVESFEKICLILKINFKFRHEKSVNLFENFAFDF